MSNLYRVTLYAPHNPRGPDGRGWNRMSLQAIEPTPRCTLRPKSREAALDHLRGVKLPALAPFYDDCTAPGASCAKCERATAKRDPWRREWCIREDQAGRPWLALSFSTGWAGWAYFYPTWAALLNAIEVPELARKRDGTGFYWVEA